MAFRGGAGRETKSKQPNSRAAKQDEDGFCFHGFEQELTEAAENFSLRDLCVLLLNLFSLLFVSLVKPRAAPLLKQPACFTSKSLHYFDLTGLPRPVEKRFERAVEAQHHVPALAGDALHPVGFVADRGRRPPKRTFVVVDRTTM
jgi:hypothetical protein